MSIYATVLITAVPLTLIVAVLWLRVRRETEAHELGFITFGRRWGEAALTLWREQVVTNEWHAMQIVVGATAIIISATVGYLYVGELMVRGWQLWTWLLTILVLTATLLANSLPRTIPLTDWKFLVGLTVLALLLRVTFLEIIPGNLHVDEMGTADFPMRHIFTDHGTTINPFRTGASWQPALYHYITRLSLAIFGYSITAIRITSAVAGVLAVTAVYLVVRVFDKRRMALIAAALMTTYHYHIQWSRIALNNVWDTLWVPLALATFAWGWRKGWSGGAVISGLAVGISHYFYAGSQIVIFLMVVLLMQLYGQEKNEQKMWVHGGKFLVTAVTVAAPIILFAIIDADTFFGRARVVVGWTPEAVEHVIGEYDLWRYFWFQLWHNVGAYTSVAEVTGFYGPGIPFLIGIAAPLFIIGFLWSLYQRQIIPVLWIVFTTFFGGFMLSGSPSSSHYAVSIPAICWLTAVPLNWLWQKGHPRLALVLLIAIMITDVAFYYGIYIPSQPRDFIHPLPALPS